MPMHAGRKGVVDINNRDEGNGGESGIVLSLDIVDNGGFDVIYTLPVKVGATNQQFSLQVDTGSSDLWIASTSCSTSSCDSAKGHLYDPSTAAATGAVFSISYFSGSAAGPIVWDSVTIGNYTIHNQALAAINDVQTEPLAPDFSGILGIALPLNSVIAADVPPLTSNNLDGSAWATNLFSIDTAPSFHFLSLALSRPGSDQVQSVLGIGKHPTALVPDPSLIQYSPPVFDGSEALFWKAAVRAITVYVNGVAKQVQLGTSNTGAPFPNAILDSGTPLIFTTTTIANAIYGSIEVSPATDGTYFVPCATPLNMTFTLDDRSEISLHPLDLTAQPSRDNKFCTGLIQAADDELSNPDSKADIILGVPFLRNVYTVMAYSVPNSNGSFTAANDDRKDGGLSQTITPSLGLMSLTDPTKALQEFHNVRVLNQPMDGESNTSSHSAPSVAGVKLPVGTLVLIGLLSFLGLCGVLFASRWFLIRRAQRKAVACQSTEEDKVAYMLTRTRPSRRERAAGMDSREGFTEDELRRLRFETYMRKGKRGKKSSSLSTMASDRTRVADYEGTKYGRICDDPEGKEFGQISPTLRKTTGDEDLVWDAATGLDWGGNTLTQHPPRAYEIPPEPPKPPVSAYAHLQSERQKLIASHGRNSSLAMQPLLTSRGQPETENDHDVEDYEGYTQPNTS